VGHLTCPRTAAKAEDGHPRQKRRRKRRADTVARATVGGDSAEQGGRGMKRDNFFFGGSYSRFLSLNKGNNLSPGSMFAGRADQGPRAFWGAAGCRGIVEDFFHAEQAVGARAGDRGVIFFRRSPRGHFGGGIRSTENWDFFPFSKPLESTRRYGPAERSSSNGWRHTSLKKPDSYPLFLMCCFQHLWLRRLGSLSFLAIAHPFHSLFVSTPWLLPSEGIGDARVACVQQFFSCRRREARIVLAIFGVESWPGVPAGKVLPAPGHLPYLLTLVVSLTPLTFSSFAPPLCDQRSSDSGRRFSSRPGLGRGWG